MSQQTLEQSEALVFNNMVLYPMNPDLNNTRLWLRNALANASVFLAHFLLVSFSFYSEYFVTTIFIFSMYIQIEFSETLMLHWQYLEH